MNRKAILFMVTIGVLLCSGFVFAQSFTQIGQGGFGDSANSYAWSVFYFKGNLYVGTNRNHLWSMYEALSYLPGAPFTAADLPDYLQPDPPASTTWFTPTWANAMQGEIWRYTPVMRWERVYQSGLMQIPLPAPYSGTGVVPKAYGYRALQEFNGYLYALGIGTWMPPLNTNTIMRSSTGNPGSWEDVSGIIAATTNIRAVTVWNGKIYVAASINGGAAVFGSADPKTQGWTQVSMPGLSTSPNNNSEIYYLSVFNNRLYASTINLVTGFEVWKTDGTADPNNPGKFIWTQVIKHGFGDTWNQYGMTMAPFGNYLYIGTAVGIGMVQKNGAIVGTRPIEIIRVDANDNAQLLVGATKASDPIDGGPSPRVPLSGIGAGFNNPFNVYAWNMNVYKGALYVGTFDMTTFVIGLLEKHPEALDYLLSIYGANMPPDVVAQLKANLPQGLQLLAQYSSGGDLWKTSDGVNWTAVTLTGFGNNRYNYGIREVIPIQMYGKDSALAIGMANPFTGRPRGGCEVWLNGYLPK